MLRFLLAAMCLLPVSAIAAPQKITCQPTKIIRNGVWLPDKSQFVFDPATGGASANDEVVSHFLKKPAAAKLTRHRAGGMQLKWQIRDVPMTYTRNAEGFIRWDRKIKITMKFTAVIGPDFRTYTVSGSGGSLGSVKAEGTCRATR